MVTDRSTFDLAKRTGAMPVIYVTGAHGDVRFREFQSHLTASDPTISTRLDELEQAGLVDRTYYDEMPPRVEYSLTPDAQELYRHLWPLFEWAAEKAERARPTGHRASQLQGQSRTCVYCESANGSGTESDGEDVPWYRTVDGLLTMVAKTHAMGIVVQVGAEGPIRYSEIQDRLGITADSPISSRLEELQEAGLADRRTYDEVPPRVEYSLTPTGHELADHLRPILDWGTG